MKPVEDTKKSKLTLEVIELLRGKEGKRGRYMQKIERERKMEVNRV